MRESRRRKVLRTAGPHLAPGEQGEVVAIAKVGSFPIKRTVAAGAASIALSMALGGGGVIMAFAPRETYMLLTDRQLLFFEGNRQTGAPGKFLFGIPRRMIRPTVVKDGFFYDVRLEIEGADKAIRLKVPPIPPSGKKLGRQLVASLESDMLSAADPFTRSAPR